MAIKTYKPTSPAIEKKTTVVFGPPHEEEAGKEPDRAVKRTGGHVTIRQELRYAG